MYHSELVEKHGYQIIYEPGELSKEAYFGVDTLERKIFLLNVKKDDVPTIERLLFSADNQYRGLHNK